MIFCALVAGLIKPAGVAVAFGLATAAAVLAQLAAVPRRRSAGARA